MSLIGLLVVLALIGFIAWLVTTLIPMPERIRQVIVVVAVIVAILYVLQALGLWPAVTGVRVPQVR